MKGLLSGLSHSHAGQFPRFLDLDRCQHRAFCESRARARRCVGQCSLTQKMDSLRISEPYTIFVMKVSTIDFTVIVSRLLSYSWHKVIRYRLLHRRQVDKCRKPNGRPVQILGCLRIAQKYNFCQSMSIPYSFRRLVMLVSK